MRIQQGTASALLAALAVALACGGGNKGQPAGTESTAAAPPAAGVATEMAATGKIWEVRMSGDASGYRFEPKELTISRGDGVKWILASGGPHDVTFWPDSIPPRAQAQLQANMKGAIGPLTAPMTMNTGESFSASFAGVPAGIYHYFCTPHLAMGMVGKIIVR